VQFARNPRVLWRSSSLGPVLLTPHHDEPERLSGVAAVVWEVVERSMTTEAIAAAARDIVEGADVRPAIAELARLDLLQPV
jgi:hypothetical protein